MTTHCMQPGLRPPGDLLSATRTSPSKSGSSLKSFFAAASVGVSRLTQGVHRSRKRRAALRELSRLSDRQLADIGLHRGQLGEVVDTMLSAADGRSDRADA